MIQFVKTLKIKLCNYNYFLSDRKSNNYRCNNNDLIFFFFEFYLKLYTLVYKMRFWSRVITQWDIVQK